MENSTEASREILYNFLARWNIENLKSMTLNEYVSLGDKDTFCQWLETKTRSLGSIKGINSSKFGIYKRNKTRTPPKNLVSDSSHSWQKFYGKTKDEAFENIKNEILSIIEYSQKGRFEELDNLHLTQFVKWKIAYLFSNERLIPIFKNSVLHAIATSYGMTVSKKTKTSEIQNLIIKNKPAHLSIYEYAHMLYSKFGGTDKAKSPRKTKRKATDKKPTENQHRNGAGSYIASQKHNLIQEKLKLILIEKYGKEAVFLEENYVDVKVVLPEKIILFEVKSSSYASDCVKEALGQILSYLYNDDDKREKHLFVAGQYKPNDDEVGYIKFIKTQLKVNFNYMSVALD